MKIRSTYSDNLWSLHCSSRVHGVWLECSSSYSSFLCGVGLTLLLCGYTMWCSSGACQDPLPSRVCLAVPSRASPSKLARCLGQEGCPGSPSCSDVSVYTTTHWNFGQRGGKLVAASISSYSLVVLSLHSISLRVLSKARSCM
jgi:hypothetical protein